MAEVLEHKGRCWITTGIVRSSNKIYLSIEETFTDDMVLSLTDMYFMLNEGRNGCTWDSFLVYKHLKSRGYIVGRHGVQWTLKNESYPSTPTCIGDSKNSSGISVNELEQGFEITDGFRNMQMNNAAKPVFDLYLPSNKFKKSSPGVPDSVVYLTTRGDDSPPQLSKEEIEELEIRCKGVAVKVFNVDKLGRVKKIAYEKTEVPLLP
ncbi:uncharacterized protein LOC113311345 [Papaver somniferum]|uniref:uncharacterized protein LOC113311345 n=1 Tax=Papaver somniferum TaxID=3469 RepID=UPI000E6F7090|nr:uncharacterized protein LOC113311345 [Papaver somniferum]